ncbi:MerR family transcriptional regulator [Ruegeria sp. ANG-S4]|uniref:MerR family transcriptional regulator n=1 Tax=Ruegeria sp. ANG-S4 TaxID=1577904 RepID=UPI00057FD550|nr:MerR family transcriptional regulator [Ruegeria sp. ANG-S4]KIC44604.1 MerR family transcriptional regulator [Ruegeria sp. ANG-S4]
MSKSPDAFRTISEVADWLGVQAHVLRFWESRFSQVKPVKRAGGRRYYRPNDMKLLGGIKKLLHDDGVTIKGVQRILREQGVAHVASLSPSLDDPVADATAQDSTVVPFAANPPAAGEQIRMDLQDTDGQGSEPVAPAPDTGSEAGADQSDEPELAEVDAAPLLGGVASLAWNRDEFDDALLARIAPIAKDLRTWLNRVDGQAAG